AMISTFGALAGIATGVILSLLQEHFGILSMGGGDSFVVDSYPVDVHFTDILLVFGTVVAVGLIAVAIPVKILTKKILNGGYKY
ncbi:MAG: ABC transporter permease, partial [Bacteroidaceae bacterium]|nr:ABC transporter permease [Bacteroidaceae bacterium]